MDNITKALDLYYEAVKKGVADVNSQLKNKTQQTIEEYEKQIEDITASVNESNLKIKDMQTAKTTASKEYKKTLTTMIAQERETIAALNLQIKEIKAQISDAKAEMKELVEGYELIDDGLSGSLTGLKTEDKNVTEKYNLWYESKGENGPYSETLIKRQELINERLDIQARKILEVKAAYEKMTELYGETFQASVELENQLLSECVAYEKLKDTSAGLAEDRVYTSEEFDVIAHNMNDYIKNNYSKLKEAGFSDDVIYQAARGSSGYDDYLKSIAPPKTADVSVAQEQANEVIDGLNAKFIGVSTEFAQSVEATVTNLISSVSGVISDIVAKSTDAIKSAGDKIYNNSYTSNYNVSASGEGTIYDSINALKNLEATKKARGI